MARGRLEPPNPPTQHTHSGMGEKETHNINVVGKNPQTNQKHQKQELKKIKINKNTKLVKQCGPQHRKIPKTQQKKRGNI